MYWAIGPKWSAWSSCPKSSYPKAFPELVSTHRSSMPRSSAIKWTDSSVLRKASFGDRHEPILQIQISKVWSSYHRLEKNTLFRRWDVESLPRTFVRLNSSGGPLLRRKTLVLVVSENQRANLLPPVINPLLEMSHRHVWRKIYDGGGVTPSHASSPSKSRRRSEKGKPDLTHPLALKADSLLLRHR